MPRVTNITFMCYPESTSEDALIAFSDAGNDMAWILHDRDEKISPEGVVELKKPHWHVVCSLATPATINAAILRLVKAGIYPAGRNVQRIKSKRKMSRYFLHLDDPEKARYSLEEVSEHGWDIERYCSDIDDDEKRKYRRIIRNAVRQNEICELWQAHELIEKAVFIPEEYKDVFLGESDVWLKTLCDSIRYSRKH